MRADVQLLLIRALATSAVSRDDVALVAAQLAGTDVLPGLAVDAELRWRLLTALAGADSCRPTRSRRSSVVTRPEPGSRPQPPSRRRCRGGATEHAWDLAVVRPDTSGSVRRAVMGAFWHNGQDAALDGWVERYSTEAAGIWSRTSSGTATEYLRGMFPTVLASPSLVERARRFRQLPDLDPSVRRYVGQGIDDAVRAVAAQECERTATT